jgi:hypothetical protein
VVAQVFPRGSRGHWVYSLMTGMPRSVIVGALGRWRWRE